MLNPADDCRVLPIMCVAYLTQALDKGTLGTSSIMGWQKDVGAVGQGRYSLRLKTTTADSCRLRSDQYNALDRYHYW